MSQDRRTALDEEDRELLSACRVGHLATASREAQPHVIPLCYAVLDDRTLVFAVDEKRKPAGRVLRRLHNLSENARFAFVVDRWDENWQRLTYVLIEGEGKPLEDRPRCVEAIRALRKRYPQYVKMGLEAERHPVTELRIDRVHRWSAAPS